MNVHAKFDLPTPRTDLLIGGEWGRASKGKTFATLNPATEETIAEVAEAGAADIDAAVAAARRALKQGAWPAMTGAERGRILNRLAAILRERTDELVQLESIDGGKPFAATRRMDIPAAIDCLEYYAGWADKIAGDVIPARRDALTYTQRVPVGVVAVIVPWNFALMNAVWKIAPALACGCTIVMKPSELTPLSALWLGAAALEAGLPPGVLNIVPGFGADAGAALVSHKGIDKISFTGSPQTGQFIMRAAAENITRIGLELGGKSANIVFESADFERALDGALLGIFSNNGQQCLAGSRILVERSIAPDFIAAFVDRTRKLRIGDPMDPATEIGPLAFRGHLDRVLSFVDVARADGAELLTGGRRAPGFEHGAFMEPTAVLAPNNHARICQEEIFGPFATFLTFDGFDEAIAIANDSRFGLVSYVWSQDMTTALQASREIRSGVVWLNTPMVRELRAPFGGFKESGMGREGGMSSMHFYTAEKTTSMPITPPQMTRIGLG